MNILLKEIFAGIFVSIACWNSPYDFLECSDKPSKFNSFAFTLSAVLYLCVVHWWMKGIHFASFYFRVWDLTREIRENKNPAKISTYTVFDILNRPIARGYDAPPKSAKRSTFSHKTGQK